MIVPMKKVSLVVMDKSREFSLEQLRKLGLVHLEKRAVSSEALSKLLDRKTRTENALGILRACKLEKGARPSGDAPADLVNRTLELGDEKKALQEQLVFNAKEQSRIEKWGNFKPQGLAELAAAGLTLIPYELSPGAYEALGEDQRILVLGREKAVLYCLALDREIPGETPFALPEHSLLELEEAAVGVRERLAAIEKLLAGLALWRGLAEVELETLLEQIEFESARAGMEVLEDAPPESTVSWITGFVPQDDVGILKRASAENGWALLADDPGLDDPVPTKLKNNRFVELLNPLTGFLEVLPGYHEIDISLWFLCFFVIFFGMIFGDAGYGALLLLGGITGLIKTAKKGVPPAVKLLLLLGLSNFLWGLLTCSWFAIESSRLPALLRNISLPLISSASDLDPQIVQQNLMIFCFSLALVQLSIGHILAALHNRSLKALGDVGSIAMLGGMYFIILSLIASNEARRIPLFPQAVYVFAGGFSLNFIFANYDGSVGRSILESLKNIISVILGIANVFSDIMSYIRLWAVGLAGAAIASTVNAMAGPMLGKFLFFVFGVVLLVFGHGLNLVLNMLSVLVHGVRLNTLEFSGHAGLTWAGIAYRPFAKRRFSNGVKKEAQSA